MQFHRAQSADNVVDDFCILHCTLWTNFLPSYHVLQTNVLRHCAAVSCLHLHTITEFEYKNDNKNIPSMSAVTER